MTRRIPIFMTLSLVALAALTAAGCGGGAGSTATSPTASASAGPSEIVRVQSSGLGKMLVDAQGRTLYLFKADSRGVSACDGACAAAWPPLLAHGSAGVASGLDMSLVSTIHRPGGARQLTYNGHPLYLFAEDRNPGDINGEGVDAFGAPWYAVSPAGNQISTPPSGSGASTGFPGGTGY